MPNHTKKSFPPIVSDDIEILILGSAPSDTSLLKGEYYAHPRNRFWTIIAEITKEQFPIHYEEKKALLKRHKIGLWDVAEAVNRKGSMDADILDTTPNDIDGFVREYKKIKVIGFNGTKAMNLYSTFFTFNSDITYLKLPSTSPANARMTFERGCLEWGKIFIE